VNEKNPNARIFDALAVSLFLVFLVVAAASWMPARRLWGLNHLAYYSLEVRLAALLIMAASFIPAVSRRVYFLVTWITRMLTRRSAESVFIAFLASVAVLVLLAGFRMKTHVMDEGACLTSLVTADSTSSDGPRRKTAGEIMSRERKAPGTMLLYLGASKAGATLFHATPAGGVVALNILLGAILFFLLLRFVRLLELGPPLAAIVLFITIFSGTSVLFLGYVSKYVPFLFFGSLYVFSSLRWLRGKGTIVGPSVFIALSMLMHLYGLILLPSFLFLILRQAALEEHGVGSRKGALAMMLLTLAAAAVGSRLQLIAGYYRPFVGNEETWGIFSAGHLVDVLNIFMLMLPAVALLVSSPALEAKAAPAGEPGSGAKGWEYDFGLTLFFAWLVFLVVFDPPFSYARNWDRFALASLGVLPFTALGIERLLAFARTGAKEGAAKGAGTHAYASFVAPAIVMSLVMTLGWAGINRSEERSLARFENVLKFEKKGSAEGHKQLAYYLAGKGSFVKAIAEGEMSLRLERDRQLCRDVSLFYLSSGDTLSAIDGLRKCLDESPDFPLARHELITLLDVTRQYKEMIAVCKEGIKLEPKEPQYYYFLGKAYLYNEDVRAGVRYLFMCRDLNPPKEIMDRIDNLLGRLHRKK